MTKDEFSKFMLGANMLVRPLWRMDDHISAWPTRPILHLPNRLPPSHGRPLMDGKLYLLHHQFSLNIDLYFFWSQTLSVFSLNTNLYFFRSQNWSIFSLNTSVFFCLKTDFYFHWIQIFIFSGYETNLYFH